MCVFEHLAPEGCLDEHEAMDYVYRIGRSASWLPRLRTAACCGVSDASAGCMNISAAKHALRCMYGEGIRPLLS
jgi:hypothetical protein